MHKSKVFLLITLLALVSASCQIIAPPQVPDSIEQEENEPTLDTESPKVDSTSLPTEIIPTLVNPSGSKDPNEPVFVSGDIPYTNPFFLTMIAEPYVLLEDEAGFFNRDREFRFPLKGQTIGPVEIDKDKKLTYYLTLPSVPQGTFMDVDNNGGEDTGVQIFQVAFWSNTWGDPFLEERDGKGWSNAYTSAVTDPENDNEIVGGKLMVWSPDDEQGFPTGFGADRKLFTKDDPTTVIPSGYSLVDLDQEPFRIYKEAQPKLTLYEGEGALKDFSQLNFTEAFDALFEKVSNEYSFTQEKNIDWDALKGKYTPIVENAKNNNQFYRAIRDFTMEFNDGHVGMSFNREVFNEDYGAGFGLVMKELSDGKIIASDVLQGYPASLAGLETGAEIVSWNGMPASEAVSKVTPGLGASSTDHSKRISQVQFLARVPAGTSVEVTYKNPGSTQEQTANLAAESEYDSLFKTLPDFNLDYIELPIEAEVFEDSGIGLIRVNSFNDDNNLLARIWERYIQNAIDNEVPGLIIDLRTNSGGSGGLAIDFAGYFFDKEIHLFEDYLYNDNSGEFEKSGYPTMIKPAPLLYPGPIAVLVSPDCVSACESFAYALKQNNRAIVVGHYPSAGAYGSVGLGQFKLPGDISLQFPMTKSLNKDGRVVIEGSGVIPDILVPVTLDSALGDVDAVLEAAIQALREKIN